MTEPCLRRPCRDRNSVIRYETRDVGLVYRRLSAHQDDERPVFRHDLVASETLDAPHVRMIESAQYADQSRHRQA